MALPSGPRIASSCPGIVSLLPPGTVMILKVHLAYAIANYTRKLHLDLIQFDIKLETIIQTSIQKLCMAQKVG